MSISRISFSILFLHWSLLDIPTFPSFLFSLLQFGRSCFPFYSSTFSFRPSLACYISHFAFHSLSSPDFIIPAFQSFLFSLLQLGLLIFLFTSSQCFLFLRLCSASPISLRYSPHVSLVLLTFYTYCQCYSFRLFSFLCRFIITTTDLEAFPIPLDDLLQHGSFSFL